MVAWAEMPSAVAVSIDCSINVYSIYSRRCAG
jgi:hypothetical protein